MNSLPSVLSLAVRRQRTAVYLCDPARERKADSESFARTRGATPYEHVEDVIDALGVDPAAVVPDGDKRPAIFGPRPHRDVSPAGV